MKRQIATLKQKDAAEKQGMKAFNEGKVIADCPYQKENGIQTASNMCRRLWIIGWSKQKRM